jgi:hypothetical protein
LVVGGSERDGWVATAVLVALACWFFEYVFLIRWFVRAYEAAGVAGRVEPRSRAYLVWVWLIPAVNLFRPKELVNAVWHATDPPGAPIVLPSFLLNWWVFWVLPAVLTRMSGEAGLVVFAVVASVASWLTTGVVRRVTARLGRLREPALVA